MSSKRHFEKDDQDACKPGCMQRGVDNTSSADSATNNCSPDFSISITECPDEPKFNQDIDLLHDDCKLFSSVDQIELAASKNTPVDMLSIDFRCDDIDRSDSLPLTLGRLDGDANFADLSAPGIDSELASAVGSSICSNATAPGIDHLSSLSGNTSCRYHWNLQEHNHLAAQRHTLQYDAVEFCADNSGNEEDIDTADCTDVDSDQGACLKLGEVSAAYTHNSPLIASTVPVERYSFWRCTNEEDDLVSVRDDDWQQPGDDEFTKEFRASIDRIRNRNTAQYDESYAAVESGDSDRLEEDDDEKESAISSHVPSQNFSMDDSSRRQPSSSSLRSQYRSSNLPSPAQAAQRIMSDLSDAGLGLDFRRSYAVGSVSPCRQSPPECSTNTSVHRTRIRHGALSSDDAVHRRRKYPDGLDSAGNSPKDDDDDDDEEDEIDFDRSATRDGLCYSVKDLKLETCFKKGDPPSKYGFDRRQSCRDNDRRPFDTERGSVLSSGAFAGLGSSSDPLQIFSSPKHGVEHSSERESWGGGGNSYRDEQRLKMMKRRRDRRQGAASAGVSNANAVEGYLGDKEFSIDELVSYIDSQQSSSVDKPDRRLSAQCKVRKKKKGGQNVEKPIKRMISSKSLNCQSSVAQSKDVSNSASDDSSCGMSNVITACMSRSPSTARKKCSKSSKSMPDSRSSNIVDNRLPDSSDCCSYSQKNCDSIASFCPKNDVSIIAVHQQLLPASSELPTCASEHLPNLLPNLGNQTANILADGSQNVNVVRELLTSCEEKSRDVCDGSWTCPESKTSADTVDCHSVSSDTNIGTSCSNQANMVCDACSLQPVCVMPRSTVLCEIDSNRAHIGGTSTPGSSISDACVSWDFDCQSMGDGTTFFGLDADSYDQQLVINDDSNFTTVKQKKKRKLVNVQSQHDREMLRNRWNYDNPMLAGKLMHKSSERIVPSRTEHCLKSSSSSSYSTQKSWNSVAQQAGHGVVKSRSRIVSSVEQKSVGITDMSGFRMENQSDDVTVELGKLDIRPEGLIANSCHGAVVEQVSACLSSAMQGIEVSDDQTNSTPDITMYNSLFNNSCLDTQSVIHSVTTNPSHPTTCNFVQNHSFIEPSCADGSVMQQSVTDAVCMDSNKFQLPDENKCVPSEPSSSVLPKKPTLSHPHSSPAVFLDTRLLSSVQLFSDRRNDIVFGFDSTLDLPYMNSSVESGKVPYQDSGHHLNSYMSNSCTSTVGAGNQALPVTVSSLPAEVSVISRIDANERCPVKPDDCINQPGDASNYSSSCTVEGVVGQFDLYGAQLFMFSAFTDSISAHRKGRQQAAVWYAEPHGDD